MKWISKKISAFHNVSKYFARESEIIRKIRLFRRDKALQRGQRVIPHADSVVIVKIGGPLVAHEHGGQALDVHFDQRGRTVAVRPGADRLAVLPGNVKNAVVPWRDRIADAEMEPEPFVLELSRQTPSASIPPTPDRRGSARHAVAGQSICRPCGCPHSISQLKI